MSEDMKKNDLSAQHDENFVNEQLSASKDLLAEELLHNVNYTPIGKLLKQIAKLPEVRQEKVLDVRKRLHDGQYDINERLDVALDKVLEDLIA